MKIMKLISIFLFALFSCESERSACDCYKTSEDVVKKILNGELPENMSEETIQEKYLKGCEWVKEVDESVLREELSDCPEYKIRDNIINK
jgi:hypothetical protein